MDPFTLPFLSSALEFVVATLETLATTLEPVAGGFSAAASIVLVTVIVRAALIPAGIAQARADRGRARLAPRLTALRDRHRNDPERLQRETMKLYRDEKVSPTAGCLPVLVQAPIVGLLYAAFLHGTVAGRANTLLTETVLGVPLGASLAGSVATGGPSLPTLLVFGTVIIVIAGVGEISRRAFRVVGAPAALAGALGAAQFATAVVAAFVPLAAGLYLTVTVVWTLVQRLVLRRAFPA
ncbi:YidC/Oxa1 family membrane protein insertase [Microbacterium radiodurans]|uniref:Membrane protein insertase YidC n=1 Tax=Microbacterium radiodurans TaxID=661398 RepID=A0A5J5IUY0_9MICO|nr:membrane protein insertase YidC [Microbacterium radiodurans]KAA9089783.1 YidC/Oxa1 family membrane protein insertase [Microbacterium radiodurans]